jgi:ribosomal protein S18 acetylase RimI-like enzyme
MNMIVRQATRTDAEAIARVHVLTWQASYRGLVPDDFLDALAIDRRTETWRKILRDPKPGAPVWVGLDGGKIAGFVSVGPSRDEDADDDTGELYAIYVLAEHQHRGVGQALIEVAASWLSDRYRSATLWVLEANERSRRFYELSGWRLDGSTKREDRGSFLLKEVRHRTVFRGGRKP